jgi:hypothetical protein
MELYLKSLFFKQKCSKKKKERTFDRNLYINTLYEIKHFLANFLIIIYE